MTDLFWAGFGGGHLHANVISWWVIVGTAAHVVLFKATYCLTDGSFDFTLSFHNDLAGHHNGRNTKTKDHRPTCFPWSVLYDEVVSGNESSELKLGSAKQ